MSRNPSALLFLLLVVTILSPGLVSPALAGPIPRGMQGAKVETPDPKEQTYRELLGKAETDSGLVIVHREKQTLHFEIPDSLLGRDMLLVSRIARVPAGLGFVAAGHKAGEQVIRWEKVDDRVLVRKLSYASVADPELPIYRSVMNNNFAPILGSFEIAAEGKGTVVIDVTSFYTGDVPALSGLPDELRTAYKVGRLDKDRSFLNSARAYPLNVDVRTTATFDAKEPPADSEAKTLTLEMHQSMVLLPKEPMRARYADPRLGWFTINQVNYGLEEQKAAEQVFIRRWRLEPSDPEAYARGELVEPVKPIVYYLDPATPPTWAPFVKQGIEDWQRAFETAGFKNAILAKDPPSPEEDPDWNGEDIRYSMVRWAAREVRNAMGPSVSDPRTGEILESDIVWYHNHMRTYRNRLMLETGAANPLARSLPIDQTLMGEAMRQVIAHEIGHALGLPHNMIASSAYAVDSLRSPTFAREFGVSPTIMDYARQNYIAQPGDGLTGADFIRQIGPYDHYAINWGYRVIPGAATPEDEKPILDGWIREHAGDPMYRYSEQRIGFPIDPRTQTEDLGDDPVKASGYAIANLKRVGPELIAWTSTPREDYSDLKELYGELVFQWYRYMNHVVSVVGGIEEDLKASDQIGPVYTPVPADRQREAMAFLAEQALATPEWLIDPEILRRIESAGEVERMRLYQSRFLSALLDPGRMQRLIETQTVDGAGYGLPEFMDTMQRSVWTELAAGRRVDTYRRNLQRAYLEQLEYLMTEEPPIISSPWVQMTSVTVSQADIRAVVRDQLTDLGRRARAATPTAPDRMTRIHWADVAERVTGILERERRGK